MVGLGSVGALVKNVLLGPVLLETLAHLVPATAYTAHLRPRAGSLVMPKPMAPETAERLDGVGTQVRSPIVPQDERRWQRASKGDL